MSSSSEITKKALQTMSTFQNLGELLEDIKNKKTTNTASESMPAEVPVSDRGVNSRLEFLSGKTKREFQFLTGHKHFSDLSQLEGNIENYIGMSMIPTGIIGPLCILGSAAKGEFYVPLATTEGSLIASYHRGAKACFLAGGATSICLIEGVQRSPLFKFDNLGNLGTFLVWILGQIEQFENIAEATSRYAKLTDVKSNIEGNHLILTFEYHTGDASGQNMVTICTNAICQYIIQHAPVQPQFWFIEGNYSGDKKATSQAFANVRGKKVTAEVTLSKTIINEVLKTTPEAMAEYWRSSTIGTIQSGSIGAQGHYANGLTALFIATGQDVACISEASVGITRMELTGDGDLYASVTLPNLIVGTVGGGTSLPTQKECLELMDCHGEGKARKFAEICGAVVLAGEISIAAALSAGQFSSAHQKFGRKK
ncbi:hydroxymethylglutaryl-CoA reductase [Dyadobacter psychrotolerans]|uniref:hydroxymethylglutaryl-CoA reductase (NADPH) n=1 Tax=Dyadobacter psychrotolerans TaxID=2541721 RepID=A0A4R5DW06_9BACT|nr:hydroxymethylglutaryl-CoA reductase [Dyadobacter psychrotolerans]TDE16331.1 3-hydroxy-3-methylglutaryl-CoA reductase [Dyadobacter psychrotolerans]